MDAAMMLSQAVFWRKKGRKGDGWFYKTQAGWLAETGLTRKRQESARRILKELGVLEEKHSDLPRRLYFRVNESKLIELLQCLPSRTGRKKSSSLTIKGTPVCTVGANKDDKNGQPFYRKAETTSKTTAETTKKESSLRSNLDEDWPILHLSDGDFEVPHELAVHPKFRSALMSWMNRRNREIPSEFSMRAESKWWPEFPPESVTFAVQLAADKGWEWVYREHAEKHARKHHRSKYELGGSVETMEERQRLILKHG